MWLPPQATPDFLFLPHPVKPVHWEKGKAAAEMLASLPREEERMLKRRQEPRGEGSHPADRQIPKESAKVRLSSSQTLVPSPLQTDK